MLTSDSPQILESPYRSLKLAFPCTLKKAKNFDISIETWAYIQKKNNAYISVYIRAWSRPDIQASKLKDCTPKIQENWD